MSEAIGGTQQAGGDWTTGWTDVVGEPGGAKLALCMYCCAPCNFAHIFSRVEGEDCGPKYLIYAWCFGQCCMPLMRQKLREKYNIEGSYVNDLICSWCCGLCTGCQMYRELAHRTNNGKAWKACCIEEGE